MSNETPGRTERPRYKEFWLLILAGLILFHRPLFFGDTFYFRDLYLHFYPQKLRFIELIRSGQLPLWDPYLHGGHPFLADLNNMAIYPTNLLYLILPPLFTFNLDIIFHILLCAAAAYWLARTLGFSPVSALVAGTVYGFCGYTLSLANLLNRLAAMPYLPLMLLAYLQFLQQRQRWWFVFTVVLGAFQIFAGAPEMTLLTWITIVLFVCSKGRPSDVFLCACVFLFVLGISAVQILPAIEMIHQSTRGTGTDYAAFSAWSLNPKRLSEFILPGILGSTKSTTHGGYWGYTLETMGYPFILSIYFGVLPILFVFFASMQSRWNKLLLGLIGLAIIFSFGRFLPGFEKFFQVFHSFAIARYPIKALAGMLLPISLLAASGMDRMFTDEEVRKRASLLLWVTSASLLIAFLLILFSDAMSKWFVTFFFSSQGEIVIQGVKPSFEHAALISFAAACIYQHWISKQKKWNQLALASLLLIDLVWAGFAVNRYAPADFFQSEPQLVKTVKQQLDGGRFYRAFNPPKMTLKLPADDWAYFYRWNLETLQGYSGPLYDIPVIFHEDYDDLEQKDLVRISEFVARAPWEKRVPLLTSGGVSLILAPDLLQLPDLPILAKVANSSDSTFYLYRNGPVFDLAFGVPEVINVLSQEEAFQRMTETGFDPRKQVFIEAVIPPPQKCDGVELKLVERKANVWRYTTHSECDAFVYFAQPYEKGWITEIDGKPASSWRANYAFTATPLPKGVHTLERFYRPASFRLGLLITFISITALVFLCVRRGMWR
jgi:hypothetical protein